MAMRHDNLYQFENLPLEGVPRGTNLLLAGPTLGGTRELLLRMLLGEDGVVIITADSSARKTLAEFERVGGTVERDRTRVVSCTQEGGEDLGPAVSSVGSPGDLTGIGIEYSGHYESMYASGHTRVRTGIVTLTPLLVYSDDVRAVYRFLNTITGRIGTADGLGVCVLDPDAHEEQVVESVAQFFDGRVDVRADAGDLELRVAGLRDQPTNWTPVEPGT